MTNEWLVAWGISLVITTVFGWIMYHRGYDAGGAESTRIITYALRDMGVMKPERLLEIVGTYYEKINSEDEES